MKKIIATIAACALALVTLTATGAAATQDHKVLTEWHTWQAPAWAPDATNADNVGWPQTYVGPGKQVPTTCEVTYQRDLYKGTRKQIDKVLADGLLSRTNGQVEDHALIQSWSFASSGKCDVKDASASVHTTPASCDGPEMLALDDAVNATWGEPDRNTGPGDYSVTATAKDGHLFADGSKTATFTGTLAGMPSQQDCTVKPEIPEPKTSVHWSDWTGTPACEATTVVQTRKKYEVVSRAHLEWIGNQWATVWVDDDPIVTTETREVDIPEAERAYCPKAAIPTDPIVKDKCGTADDHYGLPDDGNGVFYSRDGLDVLASLDTEHGWFSWAAVPSGWAVEDDSEATVLRWAFQTLDFSDEACPIPPSPGPKAVHTGRVTDPVCTGNGTADVEEWRTDGTVDATWLPDRRAWVYLDEPTWGEEYLYATHHVQDSDCLIPPVKPTPPPGVTPRPTPPPVAEPTPAPTTTPTTTPPSLAQTGSDGAQGMLAIAAILVLVGVAVVVGLYTRKRD